MPKPSRHPSSGLGLLLALAARRLRPRRDDVLGNLAHAHAALHLRHDERPGIALLLTVPRHHLQRRANRLGQLRLVDDQQVSLRDARSAFPRDLVPAADVDDVDDEVGELPGEVSGEVIPAGFE